jgi:hypothetical protein
MKIKINFEVEVDTESEHDKEILRRLTALLKELEELPKEKNENNLG